MKEYRALVLTYEGEVLQTIELICATEEAAIERAKLLVDSHPVELWEGPRRIARFGLRH